MDFLADSVETWNQAGVVTVLLGNAGLELALTLSSLPPDSTKASAGNHYFEWRDQSNACPNAVKRARWSGHTLQLHLTAKAAKTIGESSFTIQLQAAPEDLASALQVLRAILGARLTIAPARAAAKAQASAAPAPEKDYSGIRYLNLEGKNLKALPPYVARMTSLAIARLAHNPKLDFREVCAVLAKLPALTELSFSSDSPWPENLGDLTQLEALAIDGFTTPKHLPESVGRLRNLKSLLILGNAEVFLPDSLASCSALEELSMRVPIWRPPARFDLLRGLQSLDLSSCRLSAVPDQMAEMAGLHTLCLGPPELCDFARVLPVVARMPDLLQVEFLGGFLPKEVGLLHNIEKLVVWGDLQASEPTRLPEELYELTRLQSLQFNWCRFEPGPLPEGLGKLSGLQSLCLNEADFEALPDSIGNLTNLSHLNINENPSLYALPETLGNLTGLRRLYLRDNPRLQRLPDSARQLTLLEELQLSPQPANMPETWGALLAAS